MGAVSADSRTGDFGTAYGITSDTTILVPKHSFSLGKEMTAYTGLVTLVQLSASTIGDRNPVSHDVGISVIKNVLTATKRLKEDPEDADARGVILYGASISTSRRLGLGKEENYAYEICELEFIPEVLYGSTYRKSLTTLFPRFLETMSKYREADIRRYLSDAFGCEDDVADSCGKLVELFEELGVDMHFDGEASSEKVRDIDISTTLSVDEISDLLRNCLR